MDKRKRMPESTFGSVLKQMRPIVICADVQAQVLHKEVGAHIVGALVGRQAQQRPPKGVSLKLPIGPSRELEVH